MSRSETLVVSHRLPADEKVLACLGRIALLHGQLDNQLRMVIKDFTGVSKEEALDATLREGSRQLRERVLKLAKARLGDGAAYVKLQSLLHRAARVTDKRNELFHSVWGTELDGEPMVRNDDHKFVVAPTAAELTGIGDALETILDELIAARDWGFLRTALAVRPAR